MTTTNLDDLTQLIRRLLESFTDHHHDLVITYREMHQRVDWRIEGNINDQGALVGRKGAHINAVKHILAVLGENCGQQFVVRLEEKNDGERGRISGKRSASEDYSPIQIHQLLHDLLTELLDEPAVVYVHPDVRSPQPAWTFRISCQRVQDYEKLVAPSDSDPAQPLLLNSLRALFNAAGHRDGVTFKLEVPTR